ncbi:MAG: type II toxin-antitoxin system HicA family toxin [Bacillota bacterium]
MVTIVRYYGCIVKEPKGGSHWIIYHKKLPSYKLTIPVHNNRVKPVYIKRIAEFLEELTEEEE